MAYTIPCLAGLLRGRLRHSHLQNTYLQDPDLVRAIALEVDGGLSFWEQTFHLLDQFRGELCDPMRGFSPVFLVWDSCCGVASAGDAGEPLGPLRCLSSSQRELLSDRLRQLYVTEFALDERLREYDRSSSAFREALTEFVKLAESGRNDEGTDRRLHKASQDLFEVLGSLPEGIWLPLP